LPINSFKPPFPAVFFTAVSPTSPTTSPAASPAASFITSPALSLTVSSSLSLTASPAALGTVPPCNLYFLISASEIGLFASSIGLPSLFVRPEYFLYFPFESVNSNDESPLLFKSF
jgi:hypothetical protein